MAYPLPSPAELYGTTNRLPKKCHEMRGGKPAIPWLKNRQPFETVARTFSVFSPRSFSLISKIKKRKAVAMAAKNGAIADSAETVARLSLSIKGLDLELHRAAVFANLHVPK
ncbi:hypothetical protein [Ralstonia solanacearum]|uniref:hypothetical protein n=1 Tax=Ralstonia solanacearum TaxID=305 RepID=UPI0018E0B377|nr:hypothetical protein [Ralstonia solanacearum]